MYATHFDSDGEEEGDHPVTLREEGVDNSDHA